MGNILLELSNSKQMELSSEFIFYQYYDIVKYYTAYKLYETVKSREKLKGNKDENMKMDIFLDVNVPNSKTFFNIIANEDDVSIIKKKFNNRTINFHKPKYSRDLLSIKKISDSEYNIHLNFKKIIDTFYKANFNNLYNNIPHALYVVPIFDRIFDLVKNYIRELLTDKMNIRR